MTSTITSAALRIQGAMAPDDAMASASTLAADAHELFSLAGRRGHARMREGWARAHGATSTAG